jgi:predicted lipoprotein with Yx(FWY)xxD motif
MPSALKLLIPALAASLALAACGSSSSSSSTSTPAAAVSVSTTSSASGGGVVVVKSASNATLGATVLVNAQGMTLYSLSGEQNGKFICTSSACLQVWHPLSASTGTPSGSVGSLGTVKRPDGTEQVTYKGLPLYTFAQDQPGEAKGQGIKDVGTWTAAIATKPESPSSAAAATPATTPAAPAETTPPASGGGSGGSSYGY